MKENATILLPNTTKPHNSTSLKSFNVWFGLSLKTKHSFNQIKTNFATHYIEKITFQWLD